MSPEPNPFAALSLIVAPSILTNACSILIMSTSNRLARTVDRARELARELESPEPSSAEVETRRLKELDITEVRSLLLLRAMRAVYVALTGFASAALASLLGATLVSAGPEALTSGLEAAAILAGAIAVAALIYASVLLVRETRLAVAALHTRSAAAQLSIGRKHKEVQP